MDIETIQKRLSFLRGAEKLKSVIRSAHSSTGRPESTAEHSWRLCLMAMVFADELAELDMLKVLKMCLVHDLGEALGGDVPAVMQDRFPGRVEREKRDLQTLTAVLDEPLRGMVRDLWEDYESAASPEARAVKAMDKLETLLQHNQGANPPGFDYAFNISYGKKHTDALPLFRRIREIIDRDTEANARMSIEIRNERPEDVEAIANLTIAAFEKADHSSGTEHLIVNSLRRAGELTISLVALEGGVVAGHVAVSPVTLSSGVTGWYGLGPISVLPERQGRGVGSRLMKAALAELKLLGGAGCVVLGDPAYYGRFGFRPYPGLVLPGVPAEYFQAISFSGDVPAGEVSYHAAFAAV